MISEGRVGLLTASDGADETLRLFRTAALCITQSHGRYTVPTYRGTAFTASNTATQALSNLSTTATGLILSNPAGSGRILSILDISLAQGTVASTAAVAVALAANVNPVAAAVVHTTPLVINPTQLGSGFASVAKADSAATLPAVPAYCRAIWAAQVSATATVAIPPVVYMDLGGSLGLAPGATVSLSSTAALSVIATITWEEIPL